MSRLSPVRAVQLIGPYEHRIVERAAPVPGPGMVLARPAYVGLCGTDLDLLAGTMAYFDEGLARYPLQPGHEWSGRLVEATDGLGAGSRVIMDPIVGCGRCEACAAGPASHCVDRQELGVRNGLDGAMATTIAVPGASLLPISAGVGLREAALVEPMVTTLEGIRRVEPRSGEQALVVGSGTLALMTAMILAARGVSTHVLLRNALRAATVEASGGRPWLVGTRAAVDRFHVVLEAAGTPESVQAAYHHVGPGGRVALLGVPTRAVEVDVASIVVRDVTSYGVLNGPGQFRAALEALASGVVKPDLIIDRVYPLEGAAAAFARAAERDRARPKVLIQVDPEAEA